MIIDPRQIPQLPTVPSAPAFASTTHGDMGTTTRTGGGRGSFSYADALNAIIANRLATPKAPPVRTGPPPPLRHAPTGGRGLHHKAPVAGPDTMGEFAKRQHMLHQLAAEAEDSAPPPMKYVVQGGSTFLTMDPNKMTATQRAKFLPQNSGMAPAAGSGFQGQAEDNAAIDKQHAQQDAADNPETAAASGSNQQNALMELLQQSYARPTAR